MLRTGIPVDVWLRQPDGTIETAIRLCNEQDDIDRQAQGSDRGDGPQMSG